MDTIKAIKQRRSIRTFKKDSISDGILKEIIECGMFAPSAGNEQPWHFIIIQDSGVLEKIPDVHEHAKMMPQAAAGILICYDPVLEKHDNMAVQDCAAATQNMLLAIHAKGMGGCWLGVYPRDHRMNGLRNLLQIPESIIPFSLIAIGLPNEQKPIPDRYLSKRIHHETW